MLYDAIHPILRFLVSVKTKNFYQSGCQQVNHDQFVICFLSKIGVTPPKSINTHLSSAAPIAAFRKRDKQEKDDIAQERIPQGQSWFVLITLLIGWIWFEGGFDLKATCLLAGLSDDPLPRQSTQAQAAEDILDKYRNIKRPSPIDGATAGASYDGTGGQEKMS